MKTEDSSRYTSNYDHKENGHGKTTKNLHHKSNEKASKLSTIRVLFFSFSFLNFFSNSIFTAGTQRLWPCKYKRRRGGSLNLRQWRCAASEVYVKNHSSLRYCLSSRDRFKDFLLLLNI